MNVNLKVSHKGLIVIALPVLAVTALVILLNVLLARSDEDIEQQMRSKSIIAQANLISRLYSDLTASASGYTTTRNAFFKERCDRFAARIAESVRDMRVLTADNRQYQTVVDDLEKGSQAAARVLERPDLTEKGLSDEARALLWSQVFRELQTITDVQKNRLDEVITAERAVDAEKAQARRQGRESLNNLLLSALLLNLLFAVFLSIYFSRSITNRLALLADNTRRLARGDNLRPLMGGNDEITEVDKSFRKMSRALKEVSKRERALAENAADVICSIAANGTFTEVNPAAKTVWGIDPQELLGQRYLNLISPRGHEKILQAMQQAMQDKTAFSIENQMVRKDGSLRDTLWSGTWSDEDQSMFCVVHDVTDRKNLERMKQEFVNMISHDLRTPLTSVQMTLTLIGEGAYGELNEQGRPRVEKAGASVVRLIRLINELLDVEKQEAGKLGLNLEEVSIPTILEHSIESIRSLAESKGVKINMRCEELTATLDGGRLIQVMINLLGNAVKFSPDGGVIDVDVRKEADRLNFRVTDQGRGIPSDYKDRVFDRFEQVKLSDARFKGGTGLGLAICKMIVQEHGGKIGVDSEENKGSSFWFYIPERKAETG